MKRRVLTALVAIPIVLGVVGCTNPWPLAVVLFLLAGLCASEFTQLLSRKWPFGLPGVAFVVAALSASSLVASPGLGPDGALQAPVWVSLWLLAALTSIRAPKEHASWSAMFGSLWFGIALAAMSYIQRPHDAPGFDWSLPAPLLILLLPVWAGDTAAMLGGKAFGKHKMAPTISPNKTWEGAIANFLASLLTGWGVGAWLAFEPWVGLACGTAVGVFGQLGDLFESMLKRAAGKKDSGTLLPGHGGILDRIDALLGAAVPVWLILWLSGTI